MIAKYTLLIWTLTYPFPIQPVAGITFEECEARRMELLTNGKEVVYTIPRDQITGIECWEIPNYGYGALRGTMGVHPEQLNGGR